METTIQKWGNSLAVRLPKAVAQKLALRRGSRVQMRERNQGVFISPAPKPQTSLREQVRLITPKNRRTEADAWPLLHIAEGSFDFWDNADDAVYDTL